MPRIWILFSVLWMLGCAATPPRIPPPRGSLRTLTITVRDRLSWPYRLERIAIVVDGEPIFLRQDPEAIPYTIGPIDVVPGEHTVSVSAHAAYESGGVGEKCHVRVRTSRTFRLGHVPASLLVEPHLESVTQDFAERLHIGLALHGGRAMPPGSPSVVPPPPRPPPTAEHVCGEADSVERWLCAAELRVRQARRERDIIKLMCHTEKLEQMRALARIIAESRGRISTTAHAEVARFEGLKIRVAEEKVARLWTELEQCLCEIPADYGREDRTVFGPGCVGTEELVDPSLWGGSDLEPFSVSKWREASGG